jgi:type II pantothenate kinase
MRRNTIWIGFILVAASFGVRSGPYTRLSLDSYTFCLGHAATIATLSYAIRFWSKGTKKALFLRHEGFLCVHHTCFFFLEPTELNTVSFLSHRGSIGAWIKNLHSNDEQGT